MLVDIINTHSMTVWQAKLLQKEYEATGTLTYIFTRPEGFGYVAGQYAVVKLLDPLLKPQDALRTFSLASSPTESVLKITLRHGPTPSHFKQALFDLPSGSWVSLFGPTGKFILHSEVVIPAVFIAGGIGVVPFRSMLRYVVDQHLPYRIRLWYSNPTPDRIAFRSELDAMNKDYPNLSVVHTMTCAEVSGWTGERGRIDASFIRKYTHDLVNPWYYICGTPEMVVCMDALLQEELGVKKERILFERFTGYSPPPAQSGRT